MNVHDVGTETGDFGLDNRGHCSVRFRLAYTGEWRIVDDPRNVRTANDVVHPCTGPARGGHDVDVPAPGAESGGVPERVLLHTGIFRWRVAVHELEKPRQLFAPDERRIAAGYDRTVAEPRLRVLVVDDEENLRHLLEVILTRAGYAVSLAGNGAEALAKVSAADVVLCDIRMPEMDGLAFLGALPAGAPPVVMMSAYGTMENALEAMRRGAYDYVSKPFKADEIVLTLRKLEERESLAAERGRLAVENARLSERLGEPVEGFVGRSPAILDMLRVISRAAKHDSSVLLLGESGTGKEVLARAIHKLSPRSGKAWIAINCAAIPEGLIEGELFGHARGAFTGAARDHAGLFEQADGGTLFLDEIGDLPLQFQPKLLRVLQEKVIRRLGDPRDRPVDVRIIAATAQTVGPPRIREDLYYRLAVVRVEIPPLRDRPEDIPLLVEHFVEVLCQRLRVPVRRVPDEVMQALVRQTWPGNVRQLEHALESALIRGDGDSVTLEDLPPELRHASPGVATSADDVSIPRQTARLEMELIRRALAATAGNKAAASRSLDISYKALLYKIREYGIES